MPHPTQSLARFSRQSSHARCGSLPLEQGCLECTEFRLELHAALLGQLQGAYWERRHGDHSYRVQDRLPNQLLVMDHLGSYSRFSHDRRLTKARGSIHLLVRNSVGDVADHRLADSHRLWVDGELLTEVGHMVEGCWVHSDVANGLSCGGQLNRAGGGRCDMRNVFGLWALNDVVDSLNDGGVGGGRVRDNSRLHRGSSHQVSLCRDDGLGRNQCLRLEGGLRVGWRVLLGERQH